MIVAEARQQPQQLTVSTAHQAQFVAVQLGAGFTQTSAAAATARPGSSRQLAQQPLYQQQAYAPSSSGAQTGPASTERAVAAGQPELPQPPETAANCSPQLAPVSAAPQQPQKQGAQHTGRSQPVQPVLLSAQPAGLHVTGANELLPQPGNSTELESMRPTQQKSPANADVPAGDANSASSLIQLHSEAPSTRRDASVHATAVVPAIQPSSSAQATSAEPAAGARHHSMLAVSGSRAVASEEPGAGSAKPALAQPLTKRKGKQLGKLSPAGPAVTTPKSWEDWF